jgi:hypothetical protein
VVINSSSCGSVGSFGSQENRLIASSATGINFKVLIFLIFAAKLDEIIFYATMLQK